MSRGKGNRAPSWVADYVQPWWPSAEATPNSRAGRDLLGTPGVAMEVKTGAEWRSAWLKQAAKYAASGELAWLIWIPPGCGEAQVASAMVVIPLAEALVWAESSGHAPPAARCQHCSAPIFRRFDKWWSVPGSRPDCPRTNIGHAPELIAAVG
jgi:hypothetical protein